MSQNIKILVLVLVGSLFLTACLSQENAVRSAHQGKTDAAGDIGKAETRGVSFSEARLDMMSKSSSIWDALVRAGDFTTLLTAAQAAGLEDALAGGETLTLFAPTDAAFAELPAGTINTLLEEPKTLQEMLLYHTLNGKVSADELESLHYLPKGITVRFDHAGRLYLDDVALVMGEVDVSNGIIYIVDAVLIPDAETEE